MAAKYGYIGNSPDNTPVRIARRTYTLTGVQTNFTFDAGYSIGYVDVYLNGVKQIENDDFIASDGSTVGFSSAPIAGDIVEIVAYKAYDVIQDRNNVAGDFRVYGNANISGVVTASSANISGQITGTSASISGVSSFTSVNVSGALSASSMNISGIITASSANISGIITANSITGSSANVSGIVTAVKFVGDGSGLSGVVGVGISVVTVSQTAINGGRYLINATSPITLTLPATPALGNSVTILNNTVGIHTIARNGSTIQGLNEDLIIDQPGIQFLIWYDGSTWELF